MIPRTLATLFWDIDCAGFDPLAHPDYAIFRVLEFGDDAALRWATETFGEDEIRRVLRSERRLSRRSAHFWALVYEVPESEIAALVPESLG